MKVIICGAGQVGFSVASYLANNNIDVTLIDQNPDCLRDLRESLDLRTLEGHAAHPDVLHQAGAHEADAILAVTKSDEVNMVICEVAYALFHTPLKIARIRDDAYLNPIWSDLFNPRYVPIDVIISPEQEVANAIARNLEIFGAFDVIPMVHDLLRLVGVVCDPSSTLIDVPLRQVSALIPSANIAICALLRHEKWFFPSADDAIQAGDIVYFITEKQSVADVIPFFGHEQKESRRLLILGGGSVGFRLAEYIEENAPQMITKVIEYDKTRAEIIARHLKRTIVFHGDALDDELLLEANIRSTETVVSVTNDDKVNILSCMLMEQFGVPRRLALMNTGGFDKVISSLGIDAVNPRAITVSSILQHIRRAGRIRSLHTLFNGECDIIDADVIDGSYATGQHTDELSADHDIKFLVIIRKDQIIIPSSTTVLRENDRAILAAATHESRYIEKIFSLQTDYYL